MLVDMMSGVPITRVPYEQEYRHFMSRLTPAKSVRRRPGWTI